MTYRRIVVGTDGSATASLAVQQAAALAAACGGGLLIVTAYQPQRSPELPDDIPADLEWTVSEPATAVEHVTRAVELAVDAGLAPNRISIISEPGEPADALVEVAESRGADLIVVGSKGMNSASRFLLGNVPNKVSHHAPCDILIVRTAP